MTASKQVHSIAPVFDKESRVLILGSFPSVKSREVGFFYGHKQNRFWKLLSRLFDEQVPQNNEEKKAMLLRNHIAVWDVIASCEIKGSSDTSITNAVPNDISVILNTADIRAIFCNGSKSFELYRKHIEQTVGRNAIKLPSTSPANAVCTLDKLIESWEIIKEYI